ncbi:hypothetical protein [uncultured Alloprevotella sp.]|uniref:hypothetical protein n=1 Tax=uncultured Alloprevotella sp. TaxID=1283315 RepID=UPI0026329D7C|nr:hypothetical protein [uncultured Alloprevotella sp.]
MVRQNFQLERKWIYRPFLKNKSRYAPPNTTSTDAPHSTYTQGIGTRKSVPQKAVASYVFSIFSPTFSKQSMKKAGKVDKIALKNA